MEAVSTGLFVDKHGAYWDVTFSIAIDLASINSECGLGYHLCVQHNSGKPKHFGGIQTTEAPMSLLPGLSAKAAISIKKKREKGSAAAIASLGDRTARLSHKDEITTSKPFSAQKNNFGIFADLFATVSLSAQYGNFQRLVVDLTRLNAQLDLPSGSTFVTGAVRLAEKFYSSQKPDLEVIHAVVQN